MEIRECWFSRESKKTGKEQRVTGRATACASDPKNAELLFLNFAIPVMAGKSALAMLRGTKGCDIMVDGYGYLERPEEKFRTYVVRLPQYSTLQITVVAKRPDVVLGDWKEVLWERLSAIDITTPLLKEWTPYIGEVLLRHQRIRFPNGFGYPVFMTKFSSADIDDIVSDGLKRKKIWI